MAPSDIKVTNTTKKHQRERKEKATSQDTAEVQSLRGVIEYYHFLVFFYFDFDHSSSSLLQAAIEPNMILFLLTSAGGKYLSAFVLYSARRTTFVINFMMVHFLGRAPHTKMMSLQINYGQPVSDNCLALSVTLNNTYYSISTTAGDVYLADSAQVPRVHVQVH